MDFIRNAATEDRNRDAFQRRHAAEQGGGRDVVLAPGRSFTLRQNGLALIEAFTDASIAYEP